jgi:hypothetical protein
LLVNRYIQQLWFLWKSTTCESAATPKLRQIRYYSLNLSMPPGEFIEAKPVRGMVCGGACESLPAAQDDIDIKGASGELRRLPAEGRLSLTN